MDSLRSDVFISYTKKDSDYVLKIKKALKKKRINVWIDRDEIKPGCLWELAIREAIQNGMFFIACFSKNYNLRDSTYMDEEIEFAINELRQRSPLKPFIIPVRLSGTIPNLDIGGGKTLRHIHWVDFKEYGWKNGIEDLWNVILDKTNVPLPKCIIGTDGSEMVLIPSGEFQMGCNSSGHSDEKPAHRVSSIEFYIDIFPITNVQYRKFIEETGHSEPVGDRFDSVNFKPWEDSEFNHDDQPVVCVNWFDALEYSIWANKLLPSEAQWEYAARGGLVDKSYPWGNTLKSDLANYNKTVGKPTTQGKYLANNYGLFDMTGNIWEWCRDIYKANFYEGSPHINPVAGGIMPTRENLETIREHAIYGDKLAIDALKFRVFRGGSWFDHFSLLHVSCRNSADPLDKADILGFRTIIEINRESGNFPSIIINQ